VHLPSQVGDLKAQLVDKSVAVGTLQAALSAEVAAGKVLVQNVAALAEEKARLAQQIEREQKASAGLHSSMAQLRELVCEQQAATAAAAQEAAARHAEVDARMQEAVRRALIAERQLQVGTTAVCT
jgi:septal ring factor EnvC (AmiA/AmiB activator)